MTNIRKPLSILLVAALLLSCGMIAVSAESTPNVKFLVLGDSIAAGSGAYINRENRAYANRVAEAKGYDLTNYGAGGDTSARMLAKVRENEHIRYAIRQADIIAVSIGGNDLMHAEDFNALVIEGLLGDYGQIEPILAAYRENFAGIIGGIRALNPDALLVVQTLYNPAFPLPSLRKAYGAAIQGINAGIRDYLAAHPGAFVIADVYAAFEQRRGAVFVDMTHPSGYGHSVIAAVLLATIDETPGQLPWIPGILEAILWVFKPLLALLDWALIGGALRFGYGIFKMVG